MPDPEIELVRSIYEQFNETLELPRAVLRGDVEWHPPADEPDNGPRVGAESVAAYVHGWAESFDDYHVTVDEIFERGGRVFVVSVLHGRIAGGSAELRQPAVQVWTVEDGLVAEVREFRTRDEALAAS